MEIRKKQIICGALVIISFLLFIPSFTYGATSTITISSTSYLSFSEIPKTFILNSTPLTVPTSDQIMTSDTGDKLEPAKALTVMDNRNCGGFNLTMQASNFEPSASNLNDNFRVITSPKTTKYTNNVLTENGVNYLDGFTGIKNMEAPLNVETADFSAAGNFTSFGNTNTLNKTITLLSGPLTAPDGRNGEMNINLSFYISISKYQPPPSVGDQYYSTLTFTLSDATTGTCS